MPDISSSAGSFWANDSFNIDGYIIPCLNSRGMFGMIRGVWRKQSAVSQIRDYDIGVVNRKANCSVKIPASKPETFSHV